MRHAPSLLAATALLAAACGSDSKTSCDPAAQTGCPSGLACEAVTGAAPACFDPVVVAGRVFKLSDATAVAGARVVAIDANGAPASAVAATAADGSYRIGVPRERAADGTPVSTPVTLRVDAAGFQSFPGGLRQALPVSTAGAVHGAGAWTVQSALTDVGLIGLPAGAGTASLRGTVVLPPDRTGVLVVAETSAGGTPRGFSAPADRTGAFAVLNLTPGDYTVRAYARGQNYEAKPVALAAGAEATVSLGIASAAAGSVSGSVQLVNPGQGDGTSVVLALESTFDDVLVRGDAPPGLRAPEGGAAPTLTGAYTITGVPDGRYVALAAFEDDFLVRDPSNIGGTALQHVVVSGGAATLAGFKVTGALDVVSPGASGPETVTSAQPLFTWRDDSSEQSYGITVLDAFGVTVWKAALPRVTGGANASATYGVSGTTSIGPVPLAAGMYYQFKVTSYDAAGATGNALATTEDLRGVFLYQP
ncbi:MAG TPA: carboxypeptidase-like regulatory domain-containing protein [Anaeromyxobacteraceae bacterium]|nr:carboxypeptidase-like regulatory domain-containing protein [Anaeromyxobacteraceae bacterium]